MLLLFILVRPRTTSSTLSDENSPAAEQPNYTDTNSIVYHMEILLALTSRTVAEVSSGLGSSTDVALEVKLNALNILTTETKEKLSQINVSESVDTDPVFSLHLSVDLMRWSERMRDALIIFANSVPKNLEFGNRLIVVRNSWIRLQIRASVMITVLTKRIIAIDSLDPTVIATQRLFLFSDVQTLLERTFMIASGLALQGKTFMIAKDTATVKHELSVFASGNAKFETLVGIIETHLNSLKELSDHEEGKAREAVERLKTEWQDCMARCLKLKGRQVVEESTTPAPVVKQTNIEENEARKTDIRVEQGVQGEAAKPKLTKKQLKAQLRKAQSLLKSEITETEDELKVDVNVESINAVEANEDSTPNLGNSQIERSDSGEFEVVGAPRKSKPTNLNVKYVLSVPEKEGYEKTVDLGREPVTESSVFESVELETGRTSEIISDDFIPETTMSDATVTTAELRAKLDQPKPTRSYNRRRIRTFQQSTQYPMAIPQLLRPISEAWAFKVQSANTEASAAIADLSVCCDQLAATAQNPILAAEARAQQMRAECLNQLLFDMYEASNRMVELALQQPSVVVLPPQGPQ